MAEENSSKYEGNQVNTHIEYIPLVYYLCRVHTVCIHTQKTLARAEAGSAA